MKAMTDKQFKKAMDELNRPKFTSRGGRASLVIQDKKKIMNKMACRRFK